MFVGKIDYGQADAQDGFEIPRLLRLDSRGGVADLKSRRKELSQGVRQDLKKMGDKVNKCLRNPQIMDKCFVYAHSIVLIGKE